MNTLLKKKFKFLLGFVENVISTDDITTPITENKPQPKIQNTSLIVIAGSILGFLAIFASATLVFAYCGK